MKIVITLLIASSFLLSCGQKLVYENPEADYRRCLSENGGDESKCESSKAAYEQEAQELLSEPSSYDADPGGN